jgi:hypothetical protein
MMNLLGTGMLCSVCKHRCCCCQKHRRCCCLTSTWSVACCQPGLMCTLFIVVGMCSA